jgi:proline iminopeptidase
MKTLLLSICLLVISAQLKAESQVQPLNVNGEGYVTSDGVRIWYRVEGISTANSVPLIIIHGGPGCTARPFEKTIGPEIAKTRQVIYMDYRGAGRSERPQDPNKYSFSILASDAEAIRKQLGIAKWSVFGHSNGGATAITYAVKYPNSTAALILCCPLISPADFEMNMIHKVALAPENQFEAARAIYKSKESTDARFFKLLDLMDRDTRYKFQYYDIKNNDVLNNMQAELGKEIGKELMEPALLEGLVSSGIFQFDAYKSANDLQMPVLVLIGRYDSEISMDNALKFALTVPDGYVALMNKSGHHPYLEETQATVQQINTFLSRHCDTFKNVDLSRINSNK